nr:hypothetical protein Iba_chr11bCG6930 [Ipomoea batatas]
MPTVIPLNPANAPCTSFCPRTVHIIASEALARQPRRMYVGSMYLTSTICSIFLKCFLICCWIWTPISERTGFPDASFKFDFSIKSCASPSATHTTADPLVSIRYSKCFSTPFSPSSLKGTSGMRQTSICPLARDACIAINPLLLPINLTTPMP